MVIKPTVHPLALQHLRELRERWGVEPTLEESIWIVRLCDRVLCPCEGERSDLCGIPVRAGISDTYLWPLTIGAAIWYQDYAEKWWSQDTDRMLFALGYALAHARDREAIRAVAASPQAAEARIRTWAGGLACTKEELVAALDDVLPPSRKATPDGQPIATTPKIDWEQIVGEIEAVTGIPADHWVWEAAKETTLRAWDRSRVVLLARSGSGSASGSVLEPLNVAIQDLANAKTAIIMAHREVPAQ